ncbi:MAG: DUF1501 domain-containing protein [Planctomycetaceae bacterium]
MRFIQLYSGGGHIEDTWDGHNNCISNHTIHAGETDQPIGATDDLGFAAVDEPCHVSDLHATILHLMGLDYERLTFFYKGLEERITGTRGNIVTKAIA